MRILQIKVKYEVGDKVWFMCDNKPVCLEITRISIKGVEETKDGPTSDFGEAVYYLGRDIYNSFTESELYDSFEELRDAVFSDAARGIVESDINLPPQLQNKNNK